MIRFLGHRRRGQGLVEFALVLPVLMLLVLVAVDFGRAFLGVITVTGATRLGASYAAAHPDAIWSDLSDPDRLAYIKQIEDDTSPLNCTIPTPLPMPSFPDGPGIGGRAIVSITCDFALITPLVRDLLPNPLPITASTSYPIRTGVIAGVPAEPGIPTLPPTPTPTPTPAPTPTPDPGATPTPTPTPVPTPKMCVVPPMTGNAVTIARGQWVAAQFEGTFKASPDKETNIVIKQDLVAYQSVLCTSDITVNTAKP
jgi:Flp pilus assembly protein TadG